MIQYIYCERIAKVFRFFIHIGRWRKKRGCSRLRPIPFTTNTTPHLCYPFSFLCTLEFFPFLFLMLTWRLAVAVEKKNPASWRGGAGGGAQPAREIWMRGRAEMKWIKTQQFCNPLSAPFRIFVITWESWNFEKITKKNRILCLNACHDMQRCTEAWSNKQSLFLTPAYCKFSYHIYPYVAILSVSDKKPLLCWVHRYMFPDFLS